MSPGKDFHWLPVRGWLSPTVYPCRADYSSRVLWIGISDKHTHFVLQSTRASIWGVALLHFPGTKQRRVLQREVSQSNWAALCFSPSCFVRFNATLCEMFSGNRSSVASVGLYTGQTGFVMQVDCRTIWQLLKREAKSSSSPPGGWMQC